MKTKNQKTKHEFYVHSNKTKGYAQLIANDDSYSRSDKFRMLATILSDDEENVAFEITPVKDERELTGNYKNKKRSVDSSDNLHLIKKRSYNPSLLSSTIELKDDVLDYKIPSSNYLVLIC